MSKPNRTLSLVIKTYRKLSYRDLLTIIKLKLIINSLNKHFAHDKILFYVWR